MSETGTPGRYQRTTNGLIGSIIVVVLFVIGIVIFRSIFRSELEVEPEPVDYLDAVAAAQSAGREPAYPPALPAGWVATNVEVSPAGQRPQFFLAVLTDEGRFIGLRQEEDSLDDLLEEHVDERTDEEAPAEVDSGGARTWEGFSDDGGDRAYATELGEETVLVYGSAPEEDMEVFLGLLSTDPVASR
ncbi:DUF4245 family protein [Nocardioides sp. zg-579]|uniref:DUF4245 family protein n=1 Tax=Nocardioides marmotae TaxID=2663857 RepID=A0A6I3J4W8_9ACTN|nr:DUF4245 domain-containing protein [Nocardioides marmotae]MCR6030556.1 DUF4245 family protein [Gordonia jinghuaiqii]MTB94192.1 DUF4245 family protein [Nocardioides marmotae]QKE00480.1 DUF4245 family protein [Nocardioides marmotae]